MPDKPKPGISNKPMSPWPVMIGGYVIAALLTFGSVFNANYVAPTPAKDCGAQPRAATAEWNTYWDCRQDNLTARYSGTNSFQAGFPAVYAAALWPLYWGGHIAIEVTK